MGKLLIGGCGDGGGWVRLVLVSKEMHARTFAEAGLLEMLSNRPRGISCQRGPKEFRMPRAGKRRVADMCADDNTGGVIVATRLYLGNLNFEATGADLDALFFAHGGHDSEVIVDHQTGRSKGFAFISVDAEKTAGAIAALHESEFMGRKIRVALANPRNGVGPRARP
jgi:heterogeneous nuclear ribonucleoprotein A1/A3